MALTATTLPSSPPVTMRLPSEVEHRMPPPCTPSCVHSPSPSTRITVSSPLTKAATSPMKCTAVAGAFSSTLRTLLVTETTEASEGSKESKLDIMQPSSCDRLGKTFADPLLRQIAADEDDAAFALLIRLPLPLMVTLKHHVHALEHIPVIITLNSKNALGAQDLRAIIGDQFLQPWHELHRIERLVGAQRQRLHVLVVIVLHPVAMMIVSMIVVMMALIVVVAMLAAAAIRPVLMVVMMVMIVLVPLEEGGFKLQNAVQIESAAPEHIRQLDRAAHGPV